MRKSKPAFFWLLGAMLLFVHFSCSGVTEDNPVIDDKTDPTPPVAAVSQVKNLKAVKTLKSNELKISWTAPSDAAVVTISCTPKNEDAKYAQSTNVQVKDDPEGSVLLTMKIYDTYLISAVVIDDRKRESEPVTIEAVPADKDELVFLQRTDLLMTSVINLFFGKSSRDCWNTAYPNATGPYWDGDATVWGQGGGLSGYVALRGAAMGVPAYEGKYLDLTDRMFNSINRFITNDDDLMAYAVYPAGGNDRYYDDNVWIGLDMVNMHEQSGGERFLEKAVMVWNYLMDGYDETCGGGIHWREKNAPSTSKHTCSTAPAAVLGLKLYQITKEQKYLDTALELYEWLLKYMQDPVDHLFWDNMNPEMVVAKVKFSYNAGQPMLAACLLYEITSDVSYLNEAKEIAKSAFRTWFSAYDSEILGRKIFTLNEAENAWFASVLMRGFVKLYRLAPDTKDYVMAYADMFDHAWQSDCRNPKTNLLNYNSFRGITMPTAWEILHEGACVEMMAHLAALERDGLLK